LLYAGTKDKAVMIEMSGVRVPETKLKEALTLAQSEVRNGVEAIKEFGTMVQQLPNRNPGAKWRKNLNTNDADHVASSAEGAVSASGEHVSSTTPAFFEEALAACEDEFRQLYENPPDGRNEREDRLWEIRRNTAASLCKRIGEGDEKSLSTGTVRKIKSAVAAAESRIFREIVFENKNRVDGRAFDEVRPISVSMGILPDTHGSALFSRGDTQVMAAVTVGHPLLSRSATRFLVPRKIRRLLVEYEFPPYAVNELGRTSQGRREVGHGELTEKALRHTLGDREETFKINSITTASNGSSSMASVCAGSLSLMHAGHSLQGGIVAGVSMGLISLPDSDAEGGLKYLILTDLMGLEDFLGDMDFKIAGTKDAVTAIQLDTKIPVPLSVLSEALDRAQTARGKIIGIMEEAMPEPTECCDVPKIERVPLGMRELIEFRKLPQDIIVEIEARSGTHIRWLDEELEVFGTEASRRMVKEILWRLVGKLTEGNIYSIKIKELKRFGVTVEVVLEEERKEGAKSKNILLEYMASRQINTQMGFIHISDLATQYLSHPAEVVSVGQRYRAKCIGHEALTGRPTFSLRMTTAANDDDHDDNAPKAAVDEP